MPACAQLPAVTMHRITEHHPGRSLLWSAAAVATLLLGVAVACPNADCRPLSALDSAGLHLVHGWQAAWMTDLFRGATWLGSLWLLAPLSLLIAWQERRQKDWRVALFVPANLLLVVIVSYITKLAVARPRPDLFPALTAMPTDWSYPSGHSMQISALALAWLFRPGAVLSFQTLGIATLLIVVVAASRVYLQVHFPSDVIFGLLTTICCVMALREWPVWQMKNP